MGPVGVGVVDDGGAVVVVVVRSGGSPIVVVTCSTVTWPFSVVVVGLIHKVYDLTVQHVWEVEVVGEGEGVVIMVVAVGDGMCEVLLAVGDGMCEVLLAVGDGTCEVLLAAPLIDDEGEEDDAGASLTRLE